MQPEAENPERLKVMWWNVQHLSTCWHMDDFWIILDPYDIVFVVETHHGILPSRPGWQVLGRDRSTNPSDGGGVLALVRNAGRA
eukprot:11632086-Karenia_brevis.AAC.1